MEKRYNKIVGSLYCPGVYLDGSSGIMYEVSNFSLNRVELDIDRYIVNAPISTKAIEIIKSNFGNLPHTYERKETGRAVEYFRKIKWDKWFAFKYDLKLENGQGWSEPILFNDSYLVRAPSYIEEADEFVIGKGRNDTDTELHVTASVDINGDFDLLHIYNSKKKVFSLSFEEFLANMKPFFILSTEAYFFATSYYEIDIVSLHEYLLNNGVIDKRKEIDSTILLRAYRSVSTTDDEFFSELFDLVKLRIKFHLVEIEGGIFRVDDLIVLACLFNLKQFFVKYSEFIDE